MPPKAVPHPAPRQGNTAKALAEHTRQTGKSVRVRAIYQGFYGRPMPQLRAPDDVFPMAISDLSPFVAGKKYSDGRAVVPIDIEGKKYALPSWVEDAAKKPDADEEDEAIDEVQSGSNNDEVI